MSDTTPSSEISFADVSDSDVASLLSSSPTGRTSEHASRVSINTPGLPDKPIKHPRFHYEDGSLSFCYEDVVFRVHSSIFASLSPFWAAKLGPGETLDVMHGDIDISASELSAFLSILYPWNFCGHELETIEEWTGVLRTASMWKFESIRELAIKQLDGRLPPLDRLVLSRSHDIPAWLVKAFVGLILRERPLVWQEMQRIDVKDIACITTAREAILSNQVPSDEESVSSYLSEVTLDPFREGSGTTYHASDEDLNASPSACTNVDAQATVDGSLPAEAVKANESEAWQYSPLSHLEHQAISAALPVGVRCTPNYATVVRLIRPDTILAVCEALSVHLTHAEGIGSLAYRVLQRAAREQSFIPLAISIFTYTSRFQKSRPHIQTALRDIIGRVRTWRQTLEERDVAAGDSDFYGTLKPLSKADNWVMGDAEFLAAYPHVYAPRCRNFDACIEGLKAVGIEGLKAVGLVD